MYGSYPEITISARYMKAMIERFHYFNVRPPVLRKYDARQLREIAAQILWDRTGEHLDPGRLAGAADQTRVLTAGIKV